MGIYLNPNEDNFKSMTSREIYVDKTMMISVINHFMDTDNKYICVSRARRFGKTMTSNMLAAYYSKGCNAEELFGHFKISSDKSFKDKLNKYNVIKIDMNSEYQSALDKDKLILYITSEIKEELRLSYPEVDIRDDDSVAKALIRIYSKTSERFVILIDEYDVLVREDVSEELFSAYLSFLNSLFKSDTVRPAIALAYLTGILPIVRDKIQSKLNNFWEYTMLDPLELSEYVGFTSDDVKKLCTRYDVDYTSMKRWYDGYYLRGIDIYNPESVVMSIISGRFESYWGKTSSYEAISDRISHNFKGTKEDVIRMLAGESVEINITRFMNKMDSFVTKDDLFTYLVHLGYLAYDYNSGTCRIPNKEVRIEWYNAIESDSEYKVTDEIIKSSKELLNSTLAGDEEAVARALDVSHIHTTSNRSYNNEDALQSAIYLAYIYALNEYTVIREMTSGKGFADVCFIPFSDDKPAMIVELKRNDSAESAINQINDKRYFESLAHYQGDLLFIGINYDEKLKTHECRIEKFDV